MTASAQPLGDGDISEEKLQVLLAIGAELDDLDYKEFLDLSKTKDKVEIIKDFGAFQSLPTGGYIVVGVDGNGTPSTAFGSLNAKDFDPANLSQIASSCLPTLRLRSTTHVIHGVTVALIYVEPPKPPAVPIFTKDGQYPDGNTSKTVFRRGDVFVRRNTESTRWQPYDLPVVLKRWEEALREEERQRASTYYQDQLAGERARTIAEAAVGALDWRLPGEQFDAAVIEAIRAHDTVVLRSLGLQFGAEGAELLRGDDETSLDLLLDRLTSALAISVTFAEHGLFDRLLTNLVDLYSATIDALGNPLPSSEFRSEQLLWHIAVTVEACGGLAVRLGELWAIRPLAMPSLKLVERIREPSWIRHALTAAAGVNLLYTANQAGDKQVPIGGPVVAIARQLVERLPALRPDTSTTTFELNAAPDPNDPVLDSLIQFDVLWGVIAVARSHNGWDQYPSSSAFYAWRAAPAFELLVADDAAREQLLGEGADDVEGLKLAIRAVIETAQSISMNDYHRPWDLVSPHVERLFADE